MSLDQFIRGDRIGSDMNTGYSSLNEGLSASVAATRSIENPSTAIECNICLDSVQDPVVTFCGHLFCWPCIYRWMHHKRIADKKPEEHLQECPVCKAEISESALIPLYGRGQTTNPLKNKAWDVDILIPSRPVGPAKNIDMQRYPSRLLYPNLSRHYHSHPAQSHLRHPYLGNYNASHAFNSSGSETLRSVCSPLIGVFGDVVNARMFRNSDTDLYASPTPSYHLGNITNPRARRRIMQADISLGRISFFLFCCVILCLISF